MIAGSAVSGSWSLCDVALVVGKSIEIYKAFQDGSHSATKEVQELAGDLQGLRSALQRLQEVLTYQQNVEVSSMGAQTTLETRPMIESEEIELGNSPASALSLPTLYSPQDLECGSKACMKLLSECEEFIAKYIGILKDKEKEKDKTEQAAGPEDFGNSAAAGGAGVGGLSLSNPGRRNSNSWSKLKRAYRVVAWTTEDGTVEGLRRRLHNQRNDIETAIYITLASMTLSSVRKIELIQRLSQYYPTPATISEGNEIGFQQNSPQAGELEHVSLSYSGTGTHPRKRKASASSCKTGRSPDSITKQVSLPIRCRTSVLEGTRPKCSDRPDLRRRNTMGTLEVARADASSALAPGIVRSSAMHTAMKDSPISVSSFNMAPGEAAVHSHSNFPERLFNLPQHYPLNFTFPKSRPSTSDTPTRLTFLDYGSAETSRLSTRAPVATKEEELKLSQKSATESGIINDLLEIRSESPHISPLPFPIDHPNVSSKDLEGLEIGQVPDELLIDLNEGDFSLGQPALKLPTQMSMDSNLRVLPPPEPPKPVPVLSVDFLEKKKKKRLITGSPTISSSMSVFSGTTGSSASSSSDGLPCISVYRKEPFGNAGEAQITLETIYETRGIILKHRFSCDEAAIPYTLHAIAGNPGHYQVSFRASMLKIETYSYPGARPSVQIIQAEAAYYKFPDRVSSHKFQEAVFGRKILVNVGVHKIVWHSSKEGKRILSNCENVLLLAPHTEGRNQTCVFWSGEGQRFLQFDLTPNTKIINDNYNRDSNKENELRISIMKSEDLRPSTISSLAYPALSSRRTGSPSGKDGKHSSAKCWISLRFSNEGGKLRFLEKSGLSV